MSAKQRALRPAATAAGLVADRLLGEPRLEPHPVALAGDGLRTLEMRLYDRSRLRGTGLASFGVLAGLAAGRLAHVAMGPTAATASAVYLASAGRALDEAAATVESRLAAGDVAGARRHLRALAGRDATELGADEIARAVVESVAENTVDAVVAPAFWGCAAGAPGALAHRVVNTLDAQVGYRDDRYERFGWASARLDDVMAWLPARATATLVAIVRPAAAADVWQTVRRDAGAHPSPNAGVAEAAFAAALGIRLGGISRYGTRVENRPTLGSGPEPTPADITPARLLARDVARALTVALFATSLVTVSARRARR